MHLSEALAAGDRYNQIKRNAKMLGAIVLAGAAIIFIDHETTDKPVAPGNVTNQLPPHEGEKHLDKPVQGFVNPYIGEHGTIHRAEK